MPSKELSARAWVALISVYIVWGSTYLAIKVVVETMPPLLTAAVRWLVAGAILYTVGRVRGGPAPRTSRAHWRNAAIIGTALCLGGNGLVNLAEKRPLSSGVAALLIATVPLFLALFDRVKFGARLPAIVVGGLVLGFGGAGLLVKPPGGGEGFDTIGAVIAVSASAIWAGGSLFAREARLPDRPSIATGMQMLCGGVSLVVAGAALGEFGDIHVSNWSRASLIAVVYLIVFGSLVGFTAYVWLLRNVRTTITSTYAYVNPFVAVLLGAMILDEKLTWVTGLAGAIILASVAMIVKKSRPAPVPSDLSSEIPA